MATSEPCTISQYKKRPPSLGAFLVDAVRAPDPCVDRGRYVERTSLVARRLLILGLPTRERVDQEADGEDRHQRPTSKGTAAQDLDQGVLGLRGLAHAAGMRRAGETARTEQEHAAERGDNAGQQAGADGQASDDSLEGVHAELQFGWINKITHL